MLPRNSSYGLKVLFIAEYTLFCTSGKLRLISSYVIRVSWLPEKRRKLMRRARRTDGVKLFSSATWLPQVLTSSVVQLSGGFWVHELVAGSPKIIYYWYSWLWKLFWKPKRRDVKGKFNGLGLHGYTTSNFRHGVYEMTSFYHNAMFCYANLNIRQGEDRVLLNSKFRTNWL